MAWAFLSETISIIIGVTDEKTLKESKTSPIQPDFVFQSIADVQNLLIGRKFDYGLQGLQSIPTAGRLNLKFTFSPSFQACLVQGVGHAIF